MRFFRKVTPEDRRQAKYAAQRAATGWDDTALWAVDSWLTKILGEVLVAYSDYDNDRGVRAKLHGKALLRYHNEQYDYSGTSEEFKERGERICKDAEKALRWVGKNLPFLWT